MGYAIQFTQLDTPRLVAMAETMAAISLIQKSHFLLGVSIGLRFEVYAGFALNEK